MSNPPDEVVIENRRLRGLAELSAAVAHKMNNDLTEISCNLGLALEELSDGSPPDDFADLLKDALNAAEHASRLSHDTFSLFRFDATDVSPMAIHPYLVRASSSSIGTGTTVELELDTQDARVSATPDWLDRIVVPVLANAAEALPGGSVTIVTKRCALERTTQLPGAVDPLEVGTYVAIMVRDRGPGITLPAIQDAFAPFVTTKDRGRGLGLATALNVARAHRGTMGCRNAPDGGAEVTAWLPSLP